MDDKIEIYAGFLHDERCITFATWTEDQVVKTLTQARDFARRNGCGYRRAADIAFKRYVSFGVREEESLTKAILNDDALISKYLRYTIMKYARCIVEDDTDEIFKVRVMMPSIGEYFRDIHVLVGRRPEIYDDDFLSSTVKRKLCIHDAVRRSMMKFVECQHDMQNKPAAALSHEDVDQSTIGPDDSISQVAPAQPSQSAELPQGPLVTAESLAQPAVPNQNSEFRNNVAARLREMTMQDDKPPESTTS